MSVSHCTEFEEYRAAVALNNMGVALLESGKFEQAREALCDSVALVRTLAAQKRQHQPSLKETQPANLDTVNYQLHRTAQCLAKARICNAAVDTRMRACHIYVISAEDNPAEMDDAIRDGVSSDHAFVLRIDPAVMNEQSGAFTDQVEVESSIILHNYAVSFRCLAVAASSSEVAAKLYHGATQLFQLAYSTLSVIHHLPMQEGEECVREYQVSRMMEVGILSLQSLMQVSSEAGQGSAARKYYKKLAHLREVMLDLREQSVCIRGTAKVAAAA